MYDLAMKIAVDEARDKMHRREGTAVALRLKQPTTIDVEEYFPAFLEMVKNLLDGKYLHFLEDFVDNCCFKYYSKIKLILLIFNHYL